MTVFLCMQNGMTSDVDRFVKPPENTPYLYFRSIRRAYNLESKLRHTLTTVNSLARFEVDTIIHCRVKIVFAAKTLRELVRMFFDLWILKTQ